MFSLRIHLLLIRFRFSLAIFVPCLLLARSLRSQTQYNPGTRRTPKGLINPTKQRLETDWKAVEFISCGSLVNACWTGERDGQPWGRIARVRKLVSIAAQRFQSSKVFPTANLTSNNARFPCDLSHDYACIHKVNLWTLKNECKRRIHNQDSVWYNNKFLPRDKSGDL